MASDRIPVRGMSCEHCVRRVRTAVEAVEGVATVRVSIGEVEVEMEGDGGTRERVVHAIREAGYEPC